MSASDRRQRAGLKSVDGRAVLEEGAQIVAPSAATIPIGHVTSSYYSAVLQAPIALALVRGGRSRLGERLHVPMPGGAIAVEVVPPVFHDPEGKSVDV